MEANHRVTEWKNMFSKHGIRDSKQLLQFIQDNPTVFEGSESGNDQDEYVIAIDFEAAGGIPEKNGFLSLGATLYSINKQTEVASFSMWANMKGYEWEKRCVEEFWMKFPELYEEAKRMSSESTSSPYDVIQKFMEWVLMYVFTGPIKNVYLISDNVAFDVGTLRYFSRDKDISYMFTNSRNSFVYRDIVDTGSFYYGLGWCFLSALTLDEISSKETAKRFVLKGMYKEPEDRKAHNCLDDAREIARLWCAVQHRLKQFTIKG